MGGARASKRERVIKKIVPSCSMFIDGAMALGLPWPGQVGGGGRGSGQQSRLHTSDLQ